MSKLPRMLVAVLALSATALAVEAAPKRKAGSVAPSGIDETALVGLHELRREGNKVCMSTHSHLISSGSRPSRKAAEVEAMRQWSIFTGWEYGSSWGNPMLGADRTMKCSGSGNNFSCDYEARPCRR